MTKDVYEENHKTPLKDSKELNKQDFSCYFRKVGTITLLFLLKITEWAQCNPKQNFKTLFCGYLKSISTIYMEMQKYPEC